MRSNPETVAVLFGGVGAEASVSRDGLQSVVRAMEVLGIAPRLIDVADDYLTVLMDEKPTRVFNLVHGRLGEDGVLQGVLCALGIPFTGSGLRASAVALDKPLSKRIWQAHGLPTAPMQVVTDVSMAAECIKSLGLYLFVKPAHEGSSVGAFPTHGLAELETAIAHALIHDSKVLVEPLLPGPEYTVGILRGVALPVIGIRPASGFYDYAAKYQVDTTEYAIPSGLSDEDEARAQSVALEAFAALGCRSWGRVDLMRDHSGDLVLVECNTVPGMTDHSLVPKAAAAAGIDLPTLVAQILADAEVTL